MLADAATTHERSRKQVREVCTRFLDGFRRDLDKRREYPEDFVRALAGSGPYLVFFLAGHVIPRPF